MSVYIMFHGKGTLKVELKLQTINRGIILGNPHGLNITYGFLKVAAEDRCFDQINVTEEVAGDIQTVVVLDQTLLALKLEEGLGLASRSC